MQSRRKPFIASMVLGMAIAPWAAVAETPAGGVPEIGLKVQLLRFYEAAPNAIPGPDLRDYDELFFYNAARHIFWELTVGYPVSSRDRNIVTRAVWQGPGVSFEEEHPQTLPAGSDHWLISWGNHLSAPRTVSIRNPTYDACRRAADEARRLGRPVPNCSPTMGVTLNNWAIGSYRVDLYINGRYVAYGGFRMGEKDEIYAEIAAKERDRSAPSNFVRPIGARVEGVRFYDAPDHYATRFPANTKWVAWEIDQGPRAPGPWTPLVYEALLYSVRNGGSRLMQRLVLGTCEDSSGGRSRHHASFGWVNGYFWGRTGTTERSPGRFLPGLYRVDLYLGTEKVASGTFQID